jgi:signal transduction histidine kinase/FixJ family two-component response regulator
MLGQLSLELQAAIADTLAQPGARMTTRERVVEALVGGAFILAVAGVWLLAPPHAFDVGSALICFVVLVAALQVRVDTPFGFTVPAQIAFVPLLFAMPLALVPIAVVAAFTLSHIPDIARGKTRATRLGQSVGNAWFAIGPIAVFAIAHVAPQKASPGLLLAALGAQFAVDFAVSGLRFALGRGVTLVAQLADSWVYVVDAGLSGIALLVADDIRTSPLAPLALLPLLGLVAMFARERRERLESLLELNDAYRIARDEAVEASKMKSAFLANVSHEIRSPMNGVIGMNELLLETALNDEQRSYAEQVSRSSEHMLAIINDILDISTIETGRLELDQSEFDLRDAVEQACAPAMLEARGKDIKLAIAIETGTPSRVVGDGSRLRQVLMNLVSNAVKFTAAGSVRVTIAPAPGDRRDAIRFEVVDTGIGIDSELLEQMFEPFTQADVSTTRLYGGNGLGLAIAKELVELMDGAIGAESERGSGSRFWFEVALPAVAVADVPVTPTLAGESPPRIVEDSLAAAAQAVAGADTLGVLDGPPPTAHEPHGAPMRLEDRRDAASVPLVLVVEDSPVNSLVAVRVLERAGFRTRAVADARSALTELAAVHYDAVLMDCQMPDLDGYEATQELRRREASNGGHTPVIAMTAHAMSGDRERCLDAGMDDYITKPVRSKELVAMLRRWIDDDSVDDAAARDEPAVERAQPAVPGAR